LRARRGAVLAEFVIAIVPILAMTFVFTQLGKLYTTRLVLQHAAACAVRASVVIRDQGITPGATGNEREVAEAANRALGPWADTFDGTVSTSITSAATRQDPHGMDSVTLRGTVRCRIPLGRLVCPGGRKTLTVTAELPHQGARYLL
jgi:hypothetical protein